MAFDAFLKLDGIKGESTDAKHPEEIEVLSFSWGETQSGTTHTGGGGGAGTVTMQDFHFTMATQKASPQLFLRCANGQHINEALLTLRGTGVKGEAVEFLKLKFTDVLVSGYALGGAAGAENRPTEEVSLNFAKIEYEYSETGKTGTTGTTKVGWDVAQNKAS